MSYRIIRKVGHCEPLSISADVYEATNKNKYVKGNVWIELTNDYEDPDSCDDDVYRSKSIRLWLTNHNCNEYIDDLIAALTDMKKDINSQMKKIKPYKEKPKKKPQKRAKPEKKKS